MKYLRLVLNRNMIVIIGFFCFSIIFYSCTENSNENKANWTIKDFIPLAKIHTKLGISEPKNSLIFYEEKEQSYANYVTQKIVCPNDTLNKIYILPFGKFSDLEMKLIKNTSYYIGLYFKLEVEILEPISDTIVPETARRINFGKEQLKTGYIFDSILKPRFPKDAICLLAITNKDLYPNDNYNFVFGQAHFIKRVGVSSYNRFIEGVLDSTNYPICFGRIIKTSTHEIGHMFSLKHCTSYDCLLNQADNRPSWLCPECLAKLQWCIKFDVIKRYNILTDFFIKQNYVDEIRFYKLSKEIMTKSLKMKLDLNI
jgi:archaemetzincin